MTLNMLDAIREKLNKKLDESSYQHTGEDFYTGICAAQQILDDVEMEFCKENLVYKYALLHAQHLLKYGVDIGEKWETAIQNTIALNEAYLRGRQDERDYFDKLREEDSNGVCEWKHYELNLLLPYGTSCVQSDLYDGSYKFCPYCGKKIKIV